MIKLKVYEKYPITEEEPIRLMLVETCDGILLKAVDKNGMTVNSGNILKIKTDGTLYRYAYTKVPGLQTEGPNRIKLVE